MSNQKLIDLFQKMADLTAPICAGNGPGACKLPHKCCEKLYCEFAEDYAKEEHGITLERTGHETLPFMGPNGCVVPPYLRPLCTLHTCQINSLGSSGDKKWDKKYFDLRNKIEDLQLEELEETLGIEKT